jgi:hypothetical protein
MTGHSSVGRKNGEGMNIYDPAKSYLHGFVLKQKDYIISCAVIMNLLRNTGRGTDNLSIFTGWQVCRLYRGRSRLCWMLTRSLSSVQLNRTYITNQLKLIKKTNNFGQSGYKFALIFDIYELPIPKIIQIIFTNIYPKNKFSSLFNPFTTSQTFSHILYFRSV